jgi:hypothetical protein
MSAFFPVGTFEDFDMNFDVKGDTLYLHDDSVPFIVILPLSKTINTLHYKRKKMFIADVDKVGRLGYNATTIKGNVFSTRTRSLGNFVFRYRSPLLLSLVRSKINGSVRKKTLQFISILCSGINNGYLNGNGFYLNMTANKKTY